MIRIVGRYADFMSFNCPNCQTFIYNRARRVCRTCGEVLPAEFLLSEAEIRYFEQQSERERKADLEALSNLGIPQTPDVPND